MKKQIYVLALLFLFISCNDNKKSELDMNDKLENTVWTFNYTKAADEIGTVSIKFLDENEIAGGTPDVIVVKHSGWNEKDGFIYIQLRTEHTLSNGTCNRTMLFTLARNGNSMTGTVILYRDTCKNFLEGNDFAVTGTRIK